MITIRNVSEEKDLISMQVFIENDLDNFFTVEFDRATGRLWSAPEVTQNRILKLYDVI